MESSQETSELPPSRVAFYERQATHLLYTSGREFSRYASGLGELVRIGDAQIKAFQATGYNLLQRTQEMDLASRKPLLFYSNYVGRPHHFGLVLAEMERDQIITPDRVQFGVIASKVLLGEWDPDLDDEQVTTLPRVDQEGEIHEQRVSQSVNIIVTFAPRDDRQALEIARFLILRASSTGPDAIDGSWETPDMRATAVLKRVLGRAGFREVIANIIRSGEARLIVARQKTRFAAPWRSVKIGMNEKLSTYLSARGVPS